MINTDSMQVYRDLRVHHRAADAADEERTRAASAVRPRRRRGELFRRRCGSPMPPPRWSRRGRQDRLPVFVGGTGLYFKALTRGLSAVPPIRAEMRDERPRAAGARRRRGAACANLRGAIRSTADAAEAARPGPHRPRAGSHGGDRPLARRLASRRPAAAAATGHRRGVSRARARRALRADRRALRRHAGKPARLRKWRRSRRAGLDPLLPAMKAHGVPALIRYLAGEIAREEAAAIGRSRHPSLRQAPVHLVPASVAGVRMGGAGSSAGTAAEFRCRAPR